MNDHRLATREIEQEVLGATPGGDNLPTSAGAEVPPIHRLSQIGVPDANGFDRGAHNVRLETAAQHLDFRKLGHE